MATSKEAAVFLDTSVQIARWVHSGLVKKHIKQRIDQHESTVTGLVVRQEFRRRLLKEAEYLLRLLHRYNSFDEVYHHIVRLHGSFHTRKRNICLQTLESGFSGATAKERTDRFRLLLRSLLVNGMRKFDQSVDVLKKQSQCACGKQDVVEREAFRRYELGEERCSRTNAGDCGIVSFLQNHREHADRILQKIRSIPDGHKSKEIQETERFLEKIANSSDPQQHDPCLTVGDLLIALESIGESNFFTLNSKESQHLCRALGQTLIVRPPDPAKADIVCHRDSPDWPSFTSSK